MRFQCLWKEGRTVATTLLLTLISMRVCGSLKEQSMGPQRKLCLDQPMKVTATKVDIGFFIISPNYRSLEKLVTYTVFSIIIIPPPKKKNQNQKLATEG